MAQYRNRSTGQTVEAEGDAGKRLDRLSSRWERVGGDGSSTSSRSTLDGSADVGRPDDPGAELTNSDVAGEKRDDVPSSPTAQPAGDLPNQADPTGPAADAGNAPGTTADSSTSSTSSSSTGKATRKRSSK